MVGWSELFGFEMVLARISGFVLFSPILGRSNIPGYAKTGLILVLSVFVYGLDSRCRHRQEQWWNWWSG